MVMVNLYFHICKKTISVV